MTGGTLQPDTIVALNRLLRAELTAVNQQSVHLLALRRWGGGDLETRIRDVDRADFPATLSIIDVMAAEDVPFTIASEGFTAGAVERDILLAEQRAEAALAAAAAALAGHSGAAGQLAAMVAAPRPAYGDWIAARLAAAPEQESAVSARAAELAWLFACLTALGEQALVHAFLHWHRGARIDADAAWGLSGAAMVRAGDIIALLATEGVVPVIGAMPALAIRSSPNEAIEADRRLAECCRDAALAAATSCSTAPARELARSIAETSTVWSALQAGCPLPAGAGVTRTFASFERTRQKFLRQSTVPATATV